MQLTINGEKHQLENILSISDLLQHLEVKDEQIAVEKNLEIVPKSLYDSTLVDDNDEIEIVAFIGGG